MCEKLKLFIFVGNVKNEVSNQNGKKLWRFEVQRNLYVLMHGQKTPIWQVQPVIRKANRESFIAREMECKNDVLGRYGYTSVRDASVRSLCTVLIIVLKKMCWMQSGEDLLD